MNRSVVLINFLKGAHWTWSYSRELSIVLCRTLELILNSLIQSSLKTLDEIDAKCASLNTFKNLVIAYDRIRRLSHDACL